MKGLAAKSMAALLEVTPQTLWRYEHDKGSISVETLLKFAEILELELVIEFKTKIEL